MASFTDLLQWGDKGWADELARGLAVTLEISAGGYLAGLAIGGLTAWAKLAGPRWLVTIANLYTTVCRSVPELLLILILYYAGQSALNAALEGFGIGNVGISGFAAAIFVLGVVQGAYSSEILRGSVLAIPRGQVEAAHAYGLGGLTLFRRIVAPAVVPYALGGLSNLWMSILKDSALVSVVGTSELLFTAQQAAGATKFYFGFFLVAAAAYYVVTLLSNGVLRLIERRVQRWMPRFT